MKIIVFFILTLNSLLIFAAPDIVGGRPVRASDRPWVVKIEANGETLCSGSIIDERWILTAAHCFSPYPRPADFRVLAGGSGSIEGLVPLPSVESIIVYEDFPSIFASDLALMKLSRPISFSASIAPIKMRSTIDLKFGTVTTPRRGMPTVHITGWGKTSSFGHPASSLSSIELMVMRPIELPSRDVPDFLRNIRYTTNRAC